MTNFEAKLERTFRVAYLLNKFTGFLPYDDSKSAFFRRHTFGCTIFIITATVLNAIWYEYPKMKIVILLANLLISCFAGIYKYLFAIIKRKKLVSLMETIRQDFWNEGKNEEENQIIEKYGRSAFRFHLFQVGTMLLSFPLAVSKLLIYLFKVIISPENKIQKVLLYRNWYSDNIDIYAEPYYELLFAVQFFGIMTLCSLIPSIDSQYTYMMFSFSGQLSVLTRRIETFDRNKNTKESQQYLYKCVEQHQKLTQYCLEIDNIFSTLLLGQLCICISYVALAGYLIIAFEFSTQLLVHKICTSTATTLQFFMYCFTSQMVTNHGLEVATAAYNCNWVDAPKNVKDIIHLIMLRAQKPLYIHVGPFTLATVETFQQAMKTTFSIFTLMKTVVIDEKET